MHCLLTQKIIFISPPITQTHEYRFPSYYCLGPSFLSAFLPLSGDLEANLNLHCIHSILQV